MYLTKEILQKFNACSAGIKWFERHFPNGAELIDVINHRTVSPDFLHWGYAHLTTSDEEKTAYWKKLNIDTPLLFSIYESDNVKNGSYVSRSSLISNSTYIFSSKEVVDSNNVLSSQFVERSQQVYGCEFCYDSEKVFHGHNINSSRNVINSDYVVNSFSIINSSAVVNSGYVGSWIGATKQIADSYFITNSERLKHCLFCTQLEDKEYYLFNQPISPEQFELIKKQMEKILGAWEPSYVIGGWPMDLLPLDGPTLQRDIRKFYKDLPLTFWRWVKTLPGYDEAIIYAIIFN